MPDRGKTIMFPHDCPRDCPHLRSWDMSIDDWTYVCDMLNCQIDECDMDYQQARCPLDDASDRLSKICANHGLTPEGVEFALEQYQKVICEITHGMLSKLTYEADLVLDVAQERWCNTCELKEAQEPIAPVLVPMGSGAGIVYNCGACGTELVVLNGTNVKGVPSVVRFCRMCGKAVKWDD